MSSRRSTRIAVRGPSSSDFADGESSDSGPSGRSRARQSAISDDALATLSARGNVAASRMARNRESARKSRAGFSQRMATLQAEHQQLEESLSVTFARVSAELGEDRAQLAASRAAEAARASFVDDIPPKRASGSRTSITDEELRRRAAAGDVSAERMLSNRESARESRRRKWESWNSQRLRTEQVRASLRALQALCGSSSSPSTVVRSPGSPLRDGLPSSRDSVASVSTSGPASVAGTEDRFGDPGSARLAALHGAVEAARSASSAAPALPIAPFPSAATAEPVAGAATPSQLALIVTPSDSANRDSINAAGAGAPASSSVASVAAAISESAFAFSSSPCPSPVPLADASSSLCMPFLAPMAFPVCHAPRASKRARCDEPPIERADAEAPHFGTRSSSAGRTQSEGASCSSRAAACASAGRAASWSQPVVPSFGMEAFAFASLGADSRPASTFQMESEELSCSAKRMRSDTLCFSVPGDDLACARDIEYF